MILIFLILLKTILFIHSTEIEHNIYLVFFVSTSFSLLVFSWIYSLKTKKKRLFIGIYYTVVSLILFGDVLYYSHFQSLPSISILKEIKLLPNVSSSVKNLIGLREMLFIIDLPIVYYFLKNKCSDIERYIPKKTRKLIPVSVIMLLMILFSYSEAYDLDNSLKYQEPYSYHFNDAKRQLSQVGATGFDMKESRLEDLISRGKLKEGNFTGIGKGKNLIVIQVEALQEFPIGMIYNNQEITPNLNKLIQNDSSIYYNNFYQLTGRGNTSDAEFVTNNSLYPGTDSPSYSQYEENTFYGLPWIMRDNYYRSLAFHGFEKDFWNRDNAYKSQGFERFYSQEDFKYREKLGLGIKDKDFFIQSSEILERYYKKDEPFYAFMVSLSSHDPFIMPEKYRKIELFDKHKDNIIGDYLNSINYFDYSLGIFIDNLKEMGIYEDTVIAIYGDHFGIKESSETDYLMDELLNKDYNYEDIMKVPLIISVPGEKINHVNNNIGSQLDFLPTILNIMGIENNKGIVFGRDLENYQGDNFVAPQSIMTEGSFINKDIIFSVPKTRKLEDSEVRDLKNNKHLNPLNYKLIYQEINREVEESEFILKNNLMKDILSNKNTDSQ